MMLEVLLVTGINQNFFNFNGIQSTSQVTLKTNGFHMDIDATGVTSYGLLAFDVGAGKFQTVADVTDPTEYIL